MKDYVFTQRNGIHIIDLQQTMKSLERARSTVQQVIMKGESVLYVGTKKQAVGILEEEARRRNVELFIAPLELCTDNAVMCAIAAERFKAGKFEPLDLDVLPGVVRKNSY